MSEPLNLQLEIPDEDLVVTKDYGTVKAFQVLKQYLESESLSVDEASSQFYQMMPDFKTQIGVAEQDFCSLIWDTASQIPYSHPMQLKLVQLVGCLAKADRFNKISGTEAFSRYTNMAEFEGEMRERCEPDMVDDPRAGREINCCAFSARLASVGRLRPLTLIIWSMRDALESPHIHYPETESLFISISSVWILAGAGYYAYKRIVLDPPRVDKYAQQIYQPHELYKGPIFGIQRWRFWQRTLDEKAEDGTLTDEARELGRKAADYMAAIARDIKW